MIKEIYVLCPYGLVTGGPDALHQLVYYLNLNKVKATLVYCDIKSKDKEIPLIYKKYIDNYLLLEDIKDIEENVIIVPETLSFLIKRYVNLKKYIWWLSVDNNEKTSKKDKAKIIIKKIFSLSTYKKIFSGYFTKDKIKNFSANNRYDFSNEEKGITHLCASHYAYDFVSKKANNKVKLFIEPISLFYLENGKYLNTENRNSVILYNPKKNPEFSKKIIKRCKNLKFIPLTGYSQSELLHLYRTSKVYMDFGFFPGAERIPKEAAYNGCFVITGKYGASAFYNDVSIPEEYKISANKANITTIINKLNYIVENYSKIVNEEHKYIETIESLETNFNNSINKLFRG